VHAGDKIEIQGKRGISVERMNVSAAQISGKITAGKDSFVGGFDDLLDQWNVGSTSLYSAWEPCNYASDIVLSDAKIVLNDNAKVGKGGLAWTVVNAPEGNVAPENLSTVYTEKESMKLSDTEIKNSVDFIMADLRKVNAGSKDTDDLTDFVNDAFEVPTTFSGYDEVENYVKDKWNNGQSLTEADFAQIQEDLEKSYADHNKKVANAKAQVSVKSSTIEMNGTSALVNKMESDGSGISVSSKSTVTSNGQNEIRAAHGEVTFDDSKLVVSDGAALNVVSKSGKTLTLTNGEIDLNGVLTANVAAANGEIVFGKSAAKLNGTLTGDATLTFNDNYRFADLTHKATIKKLTIASGKTLDIGSGTLKADEIIGGTIKMVLPGDAVMSAIIQATNASNVLLDVDMSKAGRENAVQYVLTSTDTGYEITNVNNKRYAFSDGAFSLSQYLENPDAYKFDTAWTGGSLYILRLATASEAAVEDLRKEGINVTEAEENAVAALDMDAQYLSQSAQDNVAKINAMLDDASTSSAQKKQILREVAPEAAPSVATSASSVASNVMNVAGSRMSGGAAQTSRSGGDYTAGRATVWAQGMYNKTKLDKDNGFDADSAGFAAGVEVSVSDSVKIGAGYAYTVTDIDTDRSGTDVDTHTAFLYGEYKPNRAFVNVTGSFGHSEYDEKTNLTGLRSEYEADTYGVQAMGGYDFGLITAEAGARYTAVKQKGYTDALGNRMEKSTAETLTGVADVKLAKRFKVNGSKSFITPSVKAGASYDFTADEGNRTIGLADGSSYVAKGERLKRFGVQAGAGVKFDIGEKAQIELSYEGNFKKDYTDHTGLLNIRFNF